MIKCNGIKYYTYNEIKPIAINVLRNKILSKFKKMNKPYLHDITKVVFSNTEIGTILKQIGYIKVRKMINGNRQYLYFKVDN